MNLPTIEIVGPKGSLTINQSDLADWRAKGYRLAGEQPPVEPNGIKPPPEPTFDLGDDRPRRKRSQST
jgi:hypothetical protein